MGEGTFPSQSEAIRDLWLYNQPELEDPLNSLRVLELDNPSYRLSIDCLDILGDLEIAIRSYLECLDRPLYKYLPRSVRRTNIFTPLPKFDIKLRSSLSHRGASFATVETLPYLPIHLMRMTAMQNILLMEHPEKLVCYAIDLVTGATAEFNSLYSLSFDENRLLLQDFKSPTGVFGSFIWWADSSDFRE